MIARAEPLAGCSATITYGKQVEYQCEAGYHVESGRKSGSKPEGCHAMERAEPEQPVQAPEKQVDAVSSCRHVDPLEERFASWIGQQDRPFPSQTSTTLSSDLHYTQPEDLQPRCGWAQLYEWLEDWSRARCDETSQWAVLVTGPPGTGKTDGVRLLVSRVRGTFLECDMREVEGRKLVELILKRQGGSSPDIGCHLEHPHECDGQDEGEVLQGSPTFVCDDGVVTARNELDQKCLCLEVRHEPQNVEQALRRMTQRNGLNMPEACLSIAIACGHDVRKAINTAQLLGSVLQVANCQQLTSQRQLPAISFCCRATPRTCQRCLSCWSRTAKNSVENSSVTTSLPVERALRPWTNARLQLRPWHLEMWLSALQSHSVG